MAVYSFSQIGLYEQCPKKYQFKKVDGIETEFNSSPDLILGTSVHSALELLYQQINNFKIPTENEVIDCFHSQRDKGIAEAGEGLIYKGEDKAEDYIRRGEHYLKNYYAKYSPFEGIKVVGTEMKLYFSLKSDDEGDKRSFFGIIDRLDKQGDDIFVINDYKTNKNLPPEDKDTYREQLSLYGLGIKQKYGKYAKKIKARLHYLHFDIIDEWEITDEVLNPIVEKYIQSIDEIEKSRLKYAENFNTGNAFPAKSNPYCKYCEYQMLCPLFKNLSFGEDIVDGGELGEKTVKSFVDQYTKLSKDITMMTKEKDILKETLIQYANEKGFEQLFGDESSVSLSKSITYSVKDKQAFKEFLIEKGLYDENAEIPYYKINALVKNEDLNVDEIDKYLDGKDSWKVTTKKKDEE